MKPGKLCNFFANQMIEIRTREQQNRSISAFGPVCKSIKTTELNYMGMVGLL